MKGKHTSDPEVNRWRNNFFLCYYMHLTPKEIAEMDYVEVEAFKYMLIEVKKKENKAGI